MKGEDRSGSGDGADGIALAAALIATVLFWIVVDVLLLYGLFVFLTTR
jgi:uncharacterized membrane protein YtjA (UPF0391 family)